MKAAVLLVLLPLLLIRKMKPMEIHRLAVRRRSSLLTAVALIAFLHVGAAVALLGTGCEMTRKLGDCRITVTVVDADTEAALDSVQVFATYFDTAPPGHLGRRVFEGVTDVHGRELFYTRCEGIFFVEVEKDGYEAARQTVRGHGDLFFALQAVTSSPVDPARVGEGRFGGYVGDGSIALK